MVNVEHMVQKLTYSYKINAINWDFIFLKIFIAINFQILLIPDTITIFGAHDEY